MSVVMITGCSSGFGKLAALEFARQGDCVYATVRSQAALNELNDLAINENIAINPMPLDVTDKQAVTDTVAQILSRENRIDVLINNAGIAIPGALEDINETDLDKIMQTNFYGPLRLSRAVLPSMRRYRYGRIIMLSSLSALVGLPGETMYCASKAALAAAAEGLRYEVDRFGIKVSVIVPGLFTTGMPAKIAAGYPAAKQSPYALLTQYMQHELTSRLGEGDDPQLVAKLIVEVAKSENPAFSYPAGNQAERVIKTITSLAADERDTFIRNVNNTAWWSAGEDTPDAG